MISHFDFVTNHMANAFRSLKAGGVFICRSYYLSTGGACGLGTQYVRNHKGIVAHLLSNLRGMWVGSLRIQNETNETL
jgi:hypothetical protein